MSHLDTLAHNIATFGIDRYENDVRALADAAYRRGIAPTLAGILTDPSNPAVARERAFARLASAVRGTSPGILDSVA